MTEYELKEIPSRTEKIVSCKKCDFCDCVIQNGNWINFHDVNISHIPLIITDSIIPPSLINDSSFRIDCCYICFYKKVVPLLQTIAIRELNNVKR